MTSRSRKVKRVSVPENDVAPAVAGHAPPPQAITHPQPTPGNHPWWVFVHSRHLLDIMGVLSAAVLLFSIGLGVASLFRTAGNNCWLSSDKNDCWYAAENFSNTPTQTITDSSATAVERVIAAEKLTQTHSSETKRESSPTARPLTNAGKWKAGLLLFWVIMPPIWFWFEYMGIYRYEAVNDRATWEEFKYGQEQSSRIWIALVTALTILYFGKDLKP